jgi:hypothetical protein
MSLPTTLWGRSYWRFLHFMALTYPVYPTESDKERLKRFVDDLHKFLPCTQCGKHLVDNLKVHPLTEETLTIKIKLILWFHDLHNIVNKLTGKNIVKFEDAFVKLLTSDVSESQCCSHGPKTSTYDDSNYVQDNEQTYQDDEQIYDEQIYDGQIYDPDAKTKSIMPREVTYDDICQRYDIMKLLRFSNDNDNNNNKETSDIVKVSDVCKLRMESIRKNEEISKLAKEKEQEFLNKLNDIDRENYLNSKNLDKEYIMNIKRISFETAFQKGPDIGDISLIKQDKIDMKLLINNLLDLHKNSCDDGKKLEVENVIGILLECF